MSPGSAPESAIPPHLTVERTRPRRVPDDYAPPYPSFVARNAPEVSQVVMAYLGLQPRGDPPSLDALDAALAAADGPVHHDRATGDGEIVTAAYWVDPDTFDRWWAAHRDSWLGDGVRDGHGRWAEIIRPRVEEHETLFSSLGRPEGVAVLAEGMSGEVVEHAYWGGMRDRIPLSQTDPMLGLGAPAAEEEAGRVRVRPPGGLCLIRSGQDWTDTDGDERRMYLEDVEPVLRAGMEFLRDEGAAVGCFANRYVTVEGGERSYGMSWWRSLDALERWSESHPTHLAIFGAAMRYLSTLGPAARLRLYHEVSVLPVDGQLFEYVDCRPGTGLAPAG